MKDLESEIGKIEEKVERGMGKREGRGSGVRKVSEDVESLLLEKGEPLSIPEIGEYLPHEQKQLLRGVERLEDQLRVERIERGDGLTKWRAGGSRSAE
ncbi:hypothetical protein AKJ48_02830 [candidate division MSBL1 archaeon SCGC-AAA261O19]|uniref:Uncharacterized protein n=1 Tax=candidate division MSBL1 archaeon SCGC-AAA261O19 TaxID=1698277 RepID=A0A133VD46_9EURY|nr:hypothetical protein AKJ48_02830 [candidate division MSBL1 archaeon SCGC-AAA261O19]